MGSLSKFIEEMGSENAPQAPAYHLAPPEPAKPENDGIPSHCDPVTLAERIGIRFEAETPDEKALVKPVFQYREHVLAWENDTPETKVYAWGLVNLFPGRPLAVDINSMASLLRLSPREVRTALSELVKSRDLILTREKGRELFRLNIQYGGTHGKAD